MVPSLVLDRPLFYRETNDGCYGPFAYFTYKIIQERPRLILARLILALATGLALAWPALPTPHDTLCPEDPPLAKSPTCGALSL